MFDTPSAQAAINLQLKTDISGEEVRNLGGIPGKRYNVWYDPTTGLPVRVAGTTKPSESGNGSDLNRLWLAVDRNVRSNVAQEMALQGLGSLVQLPDGTYTINFSNPSRDLPEYQRRVGSRLIYEQQQGRLPDNWYTPEGSRPDNPVEISVEPSIGKGQKDNLPVGAYFMMRTGNGVKVYKKTGPTTQVEIGG